MRWIFGCCSVECFFNLTKKNLIWEGMGGTMVLFFLALPTVVQSKKKYKTVFCTVGPPLRI